MNISAMLSALHVERERLFRSTVQSDRGRFYIVNQLISVLEEFERGYDSHKVKALLSTLAKITISDSKHLIDVVDDKVESSAKALFKLPVFPISMNKSDMKADLLFKLYHDLFDSSDTWLFAFNKEAIDNFELVQRWEKEMIQQAAHESGHAQFGSDMVQFMGRSVSNQHNQQAEARIHEYISRSQLDPEARLHAYQFICRTGGTEMAHVLMNIFDSEFKSACEWDEVANKKVDWTYDEHKQPICNTAFGIDMKKMDDTSDKGVQHDPRIFTMQMNDEKESDLLITSSTHLTWDDSVIVPDIQDIVISGKHSSLMPLMFRFA